MLTPSFWHYVILSLITGFQPGSLLAEKGRKKFKKLNINVALVINLQAYLDCKLREMIVKYVMKTKWSSKETETRFGAELVENAYHKP